MPKKYNTPHRSMTVKTRLTKEEYATFTEVAALCGVSKAAFIRKAITGALLKPTIVITSVNDELLKKLDDLIAQYGKIGGNLNQITRHLNEFGTPYVDLEKEVRDTAVDLAMLKYEVLEKVTVAIGNVSSSQTPHPSLRRRRQSSSAPLLLLSPLQTLRWFALGPICEKSTVHRHCAFFVW